MDYDDVANISDAHAKEISSSQSSAYIAHEIIFTIFAAIAIGANCLIIYTIFRFKRMHNAPYMYLASWAIADLCSLILLPSGARLISVIDKIPLPYEIYCILSQSGSIFHAATIVFVNIVAIDWVVAAYFRRASTTFRSKYRIVLGILWTIVCIFLVVSIVLCWISWMHFTVPMLFMLIVLGLAFLIVFIIQVVRLVQKLRKRPSDYPGLAINLATAFLGCWVLSVLNVFLMLAVRRFHPLLAIVSFCLIYSSSLINFGLMCRYNSDFGACVRQVVKCQRIEYEEDLAEGVMIQTNVYADSVSIDFRSVASSNR